MQITEAVTLSLVLILQLSMPVILVATAVGLVVGLLQALTQIQDQTLPHAVKLIGIGVVILVMGASLSSRLLEYMIEIFNQIARL